MPSVWLRTVQVIELAKGQADMVAALRKAIGPSKKLVAVLIHGGTIACVATAGAVVLLRPLLL